HDVMTDTCQRVPRVIKGTRTVCECTTVMETIQVDVVKYRKEPRTEQRPETIWVDDKVTYTVRECVCTPVQQTIRVPVCTPGTGGGYGGGYGYGCGGCGGGCGGGSYGGYHGHRGHGCGGCY